MGDAGNILKTVNGGGNWTAQTSGTTDDLQSVHFLDANIGYAVGFTGNILKTINGGTNWVTQTSGTTDDLQSVHFLDANIGYAAGSTVLKTVNGGTTWSTQTSGITQFLWSIHFIDTKTGYAVGEGGSIFKYCDAPSAQVSGINIGTPTISSIPVNSFTTPSGGADGYVIMVNGSDSFIPPTDGTTPTADASWNNAGQQVVYVGTSTNPNITITDLNNENDFFIKIYAYNDCDGTKKYESTGASPSLDDDGDGFDIRLDCDDADPSITKCDQNITFGSLANKTFGDANFNLNATANSGLEVNYVSSNTDVATISGNTVTIVGAGNTNITASQAGNAKYNAATDVVQNLVVNKANQSISFNALASKSYGDATFDLTATGGASGNPVTYASSNTAVVTISGNTVTIVGAGNTDITASQAGNAN